MRGSSRFAALLVLSVGCAERSLQHVEGDLQVSPAELSLRAYVGLPVERTLHLSSTGRAQLLVSAESSSPALVVAPASQTVQPGGGGLVSARLLAGQTGTLATLLTFTTDEGQVVQVPVRAEVLAVPVCEATTACHVAHFDPQAERCVEDLAADGTACEARCLTQASCQAGACVGAPKSCDDGNACTADACDPSSGCLHADISAQCQAPPGDDCVDSRCASPDYFDPGACQVAYCDPKVGCATAPAADGTSCGANDCTIARVCLGGRCQERPSPEGSACSAATLCQSAGRCVANQCQTPAPTALQPVWQLLDDPHVHHYLFGVVGPTGLVYGIERLDVGVQYLAWDEGGFERWRTPVMTEFQSSTAMLDLERGQLIVASKSWVRALDAVTGAQRWFVELGAQIPVGNPDPQGNKLVYPIKLTLQSTAKQAVVGFSEGYESHQVWLFGLDLRTGQQAFKLNRGGHLYGLMTLANDEVFLGSAGCWAPASWNAVLDASGGLKWNLFQAGLPQLTTGAELFFQGRDQSGVSTLGRVDPVTGAYQLERPGNEEALLFSAPLLYTQQGTTLSAWNIAQRQLAWSLSGTVAGQSFLTAAQDVLTVGTHTVEKVDHLGQRSWSCPLPQPYVSSSTASLVKGRLVVQTDLGLAAYAVGPLEVASTGWSVSGRGNPERTSRAR